MTKNQKTIEERTEEIALIGNWENRFIKIPAEMFYKTILPFGWYLVTISKATTYNRG